MTFPLVVGRRSATGWGGIACRLARTTRSIVGDRPHTGLLADSGLRPDRDVVTDGHAGARRDRPGAAYHRDDRLIGALTANRAAYRARPAGDLSPTMTA
ncbi:hypothetical protein [Actinoplanes philippinensis]|uniref:hypothetical protein n=1 Tax=Actinoplanes philippinensis TaxID=35752 RepID=UPI0033F28012